MLLAEVCGCRAPLASERTEALSATEPQEQAKDGDATAQYNLGICYYNGDGVAVDKAEAVKWLRKAAEKGHLQAQTLIGAFYFQGDGVAVDKAEAIKWFRKAAVQGYPQAQSILGSCYFKGEGVAEDQAEAVKWFRKAAEKGHPESQGMLGLCYFKGEGVAVNYAEAVKWFRKAAEKGRPESQTMLGMCYLNGEGVAADKTEAVKWLWKAAEQGYLLAQEELEKISGTVPAEQLYLTPTGRVDFVERQAADWLSIHEFASNEDPGDVSVKWRVAWPESLSGLNNEGLSSVRREILQMTFGPAWSDLNHGDKTWIPPPTIEEAEEEIKRKLEEPDIAWEFSGDVELDRPFGASLQDGAEWYARPVIVAKNEGNSSFRWECGCTYYTIARTFSIPDGREMTVDDYFDRGKMKELSALVWRRLLESVFPFDDETRKGMGHRDINLRDRDLIFMRVMSGGICFYFAPYSIFSGADGVTKAFLKWGELSKFRKK
jgi:TPR repeat protein